LPLGNRRVSFTVLMQEQAMAVPALDDVQTILAEFEQRLRAVVDRAWAEWMECDVRGRLIFSRSGSNTIFDFIARHALAEFGEDPQVHDIAKGGTVQFLFRDRVLVRFKKSNANGVGSNIETQAVLDFVDPHRDIPGMLPDIMKVEVCYQTDALGTQLKEVAVVARNRTKRVWAYPLTPAQTAEIIPLRIVATGDTPAIVITPKKPSDEVAGEDAE
jgi:hypothetical protein